MSRHRHEEAPGAPAGGFRRWRWVLIALVVAGAAVDLARSSFIWVVGGRNGEFLVSRYPIVEERWDHPRLQLLRKREKLDEVVASGKTEFEKIVLLRKWAHDQWRSGGNFYYPPFDAVEILDLARRRKNYGFCAQYAIVFLQACRSMGLHARYVDLGHFVAAVWSDDFNRWVVMDPTNDIHFEREGVPLRGRDIYDAHWKKDIAGIEKVGSDGSRAPITQEDAAVYANYSILLRNNQLTEPGVISQNGVKHKLTHEEDYRRYPLVGRDFVGYGDAFLAWHREGVKDPWPERMTTDDPDDLRDVEDQTFIFVAARDSRKGVAKLKLLTDNSPEFKAFEGRSDVESYTEFAVPEVVWELKPGFHTFFARARTQSGLRGPESHVDIYYKSNWLKGLVKRP